MQKYFKLGPHLLPLSNKLSTTTVLYALLIIHFNVGVNDYQMTK